MRVVIVGGGFGGVKTALELAKDRKVSVTLVSDRDHFLFYPALYSTATGHSRQPSVIPLSKFFHNHSNIKVVHDTVTGLDLPRKIVVGENGQYQYDRAVFAMGVVTTYFGITGLDEYSYSIKSAEEVMRFKKHLHEYVAADRHLDKNYVIVGAGPTGVELTASLASYLAHIAKKHDVHRSKVSLDLVEAAPRVLPRMSEAASRMVTKRLKELGVKVMTNKKVEMQDDDSIMVSGRDIESRTVVWTSGVSNHPFFKEHGDIFRIAPNGKVEVDPQLQAAHHVYVIGDNANTQYAGLAQTAVHNARFVARVIHAQIHGEQEPVFSAQTPAVVVPVGHNWAIFEYKGLRLSGLLGAWVRRAADFIAYMELFPPKVAWRLWWAEAHSEDACDICDLS